MTSELIDADPTVEMVLEFHTAFACHVEPSPKLPPPTAAGNVALIEAARLLMEARLILREHGKEDVRCSRVALIAEETAELANAFVDYNLVKVLDAFLDIGYVNAGGVTNCGLQDVYAEGMRRVHQSNMSKLSDEGTPIHDAAGKVVKGPNYKPVDLTDLVE